MPHSTSSRPRRIAIIGAGISGIATAAHLLRHNVENAPPLFEVTVFERSSFVGGVWKYDERQPAEAAYPNEIPPVGNLLDTPASSQPSYPEQDGVQTCDQPRAVDKDHDRTDYERIRLLHAPPGPAYKGLKNNVPTSLMHSTLQAWPDGTEDYVNNTLIVGYIRDLADSTGAREHVVLNTSVESIRKEHEEDDKLDSLSGEDAAGKRLYSGEWTVHTKTLLPPSSQPQQEQLFKHATHKFDAIVVAAGHYHLPRLPVMPGLDTWRDAFPGSVTHAQRYRVPEEYPGKRVLVIGSSASAHDIAKELTGVGKTVYVSSRGGAWDLNAPEPSIRVSGIDKFEVVEADAGSAGDDGASAFPGSEKRGVVRLTDGTVLHDIDHVILATGYLTSYPFLGPRLQNPQVTADEADEDIIVTQDGLLTHNLHKDVWYIPDPSLAFVGVIFHSSTFSMFDFQASIVARVLASATELPSREAMRSEYIERKSKYLTPSALRSFHSLMGRETEYIDDVLSWVNADARRRGLPEIKALSEKWYKRYEGFREEVKVRRAANQSVPTGAVVYGPHGRVEREEELQAGTSAANTEEESALAVQDTTQKRWRTGQAETARAETHKRLKSESGQAVAAA